MAARKNPPKPPGYCCTKWQEQPAARRSSMVWVLLHRWAHSRTSFSVEGYAERAGIELKEAEENIRIANDWKWFQRVPDPSNRTLYAGQLTRRA